MTMTVHYTVDATARRAESGDYLGCHAVVETVTEADGASKTMTSSEFAVFDSPIAAALCAEKMNSAPGAQAALA